MDYNDANYIYTTLRADATIRALIPSTVFTYAIFNSIQIPETETAKDKINIYPVTPFSGSSPVNVRNVSCNCRAELESKSRTMAIACYEALNRINRTSGGQKFYTKCNVLRTIEPVDDTDVFNTPIEIEVSWR